MKKFRQKLIALFMILSFSISWVTPSYAIAKAATPTSQKSLQIVGDANIKNGNKRLSVSLRDSNVKQALRMFADKAGLNIIFHDSVEDKTITLDLVGVTLNDAIRMVMQATDLSYFVDGQTLIIMSAEKSKEMNISKQNMMLLPIKYADATDVAEFLNKNIFSINKPGLSNTEIVAVSPANNELVIFGTQSDYNMAKKVVAMLDEPARITNFKVNHVTPQEMAKNICTALIKGYSQDESGDNNSSDKDNDNNNNDDNDSNSSGSGGGGSSSGLSAGSAGGNKVKLGKAKLACVTGNASKDSKGGNSSSSNSNGTLYSLNKNGMKIMYYETLGMISIVGGSKDQVDTIGAFISATDIKQPMAYLEFSIIELSEDGSKDFETNWSFLTQNFGITFARVEGGGAQLFTGGDLSGSTPISFLTNNRTPATTGTATLQGYFKYLVDNGKAKTLANPKVLVTSGKESIIDLSQDYLKTLKATTNVGTGGTTTSYNPELGSDAGIIVSVTPYISRDGYVVMNLGPTYATTLAPIMGSNGQILATPLSRRNIELSNVRVKDGDTLVIGGLIQEDESETVQKIPLLGDIPGLGFFFRNTKVVRSKQELVILITPHIVKESEDVVTTGNTNTNL